jgi:hypothetical protein
MKPIDCKWRANWSRDWSIAFNVCPPQKFARAQRNSFLDFFCWRHSSKAATPVR